MVRSLHIKTDRLPISGASNVLHLIGHTFLSYSLTEIDYSLESLIEVIGLLAGLPKYEKISSKTEVLLEQSRNEIFYLQDAENLLKSANNIVRLLPALDLKDEESENKSKNNRRL